MQKVIKITDRKFVRYSIAELKKYVKSFYNDNLKGSTVVNRHKQISIVLPSSGINHSLYGRPAGYEKLIVVPFLKSMLEQARFVNFRNPDKGDIGIVGFMNFNVKVSINSKIHTFRLVVRITKGGKYYYDHSVRIKK